MGTHPIFESDFDCLTAMKCAGIGLNADEVEILTHPTDFYNQLLRNIENAQNRLVLSSLYIGGDEMALQLYQTIEDFCARGGEALIILDYNRGQRGASSSRKFLSEIRQKYPGKLRLKFYKSVLQDQSKIASKIPQLKETVSTQHTKIYACDDKLILSGANLEKAYFMNRQDRYIQFESKNLVDFFVNLAETIGRHSCEESEGKLIGPSGNLDLSADLFNSFNQIEQAEESNDTVFYPNVQAGWSNVNLEETYLISALQSLTHEDTLHFCSGYLNPPESLTEVLATTPAKINLMSADPRSNGFYKTRFPKSGITPAYQLFADHLIEQLNEREYTLHEWHREKWTFHAKGMWFSRGSECFGTTIGSSNFSCRSHYRDLEAGGIISTRNKLLMDKLTMERQNIWLHQSNRQLHAVPKWVKIVAPKIRSFL